MYTNSKTRRQFLIGGAKTALALPFLPSLWPRHAWGQALPIQKRLIATGMPLGGYSSADLYPTYSADIAMNLYPGHDIFSTNLRTSSGLGSISKIYSSALNPFLSKLSLLRGLDCPMPFGHCDATMLGHMRNERLNGFQDPTNRTSGAEVLPQYPNLPDITEFLAQSSYVYGSNAPVIRSVVGYHGFSLGQITPGNPNSGIKYVRAIASPKSLFDALFGPATPPVSGGGGPTADQANSKTIVDSVIQDLASIVGGKNISTSDKVRLDEFVTELHEVNKKLIQTPSAVCTMPSAPSQTTAMDNVPTTLDRELFLDLYTSVLAAAIKCGRTQVAKLTGPLTVASQGKYTFDNLHGWGHDGSVAAQTQIGDTMRWLIEKMFVPLITKLDVAEGNGKTYLDNSIVFFTNINSNKVHTNWDRTMLIAGSAGGFLKNGLFIDYRQRGVSANYGQPGILYNQFIITMLKAMGVPDTDPYMPLYAKADLIVPPDSSGNFWNTLRKDNGRHVHEVCIKDSGKILPILV